MVQTIDITRALAISGWMTEPELVWLAERAREHRLIVEIGSYLGRSTRAMLDHTSGVVYAIDDWKGPRDVYMTKEERAGLFTHFLQNTQCPKLVPVLADHKVATLYGVIPDMVFIDGSHEYEDVKRDIQMWLSRITKGGLLCGHDAGVFEGVDRAVQELLGDVEVDEDTSIWYKVVGDKI